MMSKFEINIPYTEEELRVIGLPEKEQEKAWLELLQNCDFEKDTLLRICSMLKTDGLLPMFHSEGIHISKITASKAYNMLKEHGFECLSDSTLKMLHSTKKKIKNGESLNDEEKICQGFLEELDTSEEGHISGRCYTVAYNHFETILCNRCKEEGNMCDYLLDHTILTLSLDGVLASGEKEFISQYFSDKEKEMERE